MEGDAGSQEDYQSPAAPEKSASSAQSRSSKLSSTKTAVMYPYSWTHALFSLAVGLLGSVGLALFAISDYGCFLLMYSNASELTEKREHVVSHSNSALGHNVWIGYALASYHLIMVFSRASIKGPEELYNQLWACNTGMALASSGMILQRPIMVGAAVGVVAIDQVLWYFDVLLKVLTGKYKIGVARYLDWPETPFVQKVFSWHHLWFMPACLYYLRMTGPGMPSGALRLAVLGVLSMTLLSRSLTPRVLNINMCYEFWKDIKIAPLHVCDGKPFYIYVPWILVVFNAINLPLWPLLVALAGGWERP